jgi:hypothetical protein
VSARTKYEISDCRLQISDLQKAARRAGPIQSKSAIEIRQFGGAAAMTGL